MRSLLIHQAFVGPDEPGGTRHYEFARACAAAGDRFVIVASSLSYLSGQRCAGGHDAVDGEAPVQVRRAYTLPVLHRGFGWRVLSFLSFMVTSTLAALRAGRVDVVIGTSPPIFQALSAWLVARLRRRPFLLEIRDLWPDFAIDLGILRSRPLIALSRWLESFLYRRATHLVVNSPAYREHLLRRGVSADRISLIANGVDPDLFDPAARGERVRRELGLDECFVVTYAGALGPANDIPTILRAATRLAARPEIRILLVGDGKDRPALVEQARAAGLRNVIFTGARPKSEMPEILAASDACLATLRDIPMFRTTYPNKVFDYMAAGRPVILAIDGVIREVVEAGHAGLFVPPGDDATLADAILRLSQDAERAKELGRNGRRHVSAHFNRHDQARAFADLLHSLAPTSDLGPRAETQPCRTT